MLVSTLNKLNEPLEVRDLRLQLRNKLLLHFDRVHHLFSWLVWLVTWQALV